MKKVSNTHKILQCIIINKGISRAEISRTLGLNKATVSYIISDLEKNKLIKQQEELKVTSGRHSVLYELNENYSKILSINVRPQLINVFITNLKGDKKEEEILDVRVRSEKDLESNLTQIIDKYTKTYKNILGVGIGVHGTVYLNETIHFTPYNDIQKFDIKSKLLKKFSNLNIYVENEANITSLGENHYLDKKNVVTISNSKGIGSGIIVDFKIYKGSEGFAGEIGHTIVVPNGLPCACGNNGCLEQYSSEENLIQKASEIKGRDVSIIDFIQLFNDNDVEIKELYYQSLDYLAIAINNIIALLNPSNVILNGYLYTNIKKTKEYITMKLKSEVYNSDNLLISNNYEEAFVYGFAKHIVREKFITNDTWVEKVK